MFSYIIFLQWKPGILVQFKRVAFSDTQQTVTGTFNVNTKSQYYKPALERLCLTRPPITVSTTDRESCVRTPPMPLRNLRDMNPSPGKSPPLKRQHPLPPPPLLTVCSPVTRPGQAILVDQVERIFRKSKRSSIQWKFCRFFLSTIKTTS